VSDRDWLAHLDDRVESLRVLVDQGAAARSADRATFDKQLDSHRQELREEILRSTRDGWQLIAAGLVLSALGIIIGGLA
jgi:hypothetical protein